MYNSETSFLLNEIKEYEKRIEYLQEENYKLKQRNEKLKRLLIDARQIE